MSSLSELQKHLALQGLFIRGSFCTDNDDSFDSLPNSSSSTLVMIGNLGSSLWPAFSSSKPYQDDEANPMDRWSKSIGERLAKRFNGIAYYPFSGPPFKPFLEWAHKAENSHASPLGLHIHPDVGLWHAYRFALLLPIKAPINLTHQLPHPCDQCSEKPCLSACPVEAFSEGEYHVQICRDSLKFQQTSECMKAGCLARRACPIGKKHQYNPEQITFHMHAFAN